MNTLNRTASTPLFQQLAAVLRESIESGLIAEGVVIPELKQLAEEYEVPQAVARRALDRLAETGWASRHPRKGLIASRPRPVSGVVLGWDPAELGFDVDGGREIRVISKVMTTLPRESLNQFETHGKSGHQAFRVTKLYCVDNRPKALEVILSPTSELPGLLMRDHRHANIYRLIETDFAHKIVRVSQKVYLRSLNLEEAKALESVEDFPAVCVERLVYGERGALARVEWIVPGGRCALVDEGYSDHGLGR